MASSAERRTKSTVTTSLFELHFVVDFVIMVGVGLPDYDGKRTLILGVKTLQSKLWMIENFWLFIGDIESGAAMRV